jgi:hypothetical protein
MTHWIGRRQFIAGSAALSLAAITPSRASWA